MEETLNKYKRYIMFDEANYEKLLRLRSNETPLTHNEVGIIQVVYN